MTGRKGIPAKICYGIGEISITVNLVIFGLFILFFYNSVMELPGTLVGIASALGLLWDALIDPYIGFHSDNTVSRWGRRHLYMFWGSLTMGISFWLLLSPPLGLTTSQLFLWLLGATFLFRFTSALYRIPYLSLGAEMSDDYQERTWIVGIRSFFGLWGTLGAATLSFILFFPEASSGAGARMNYESYSNMGLAFGGVMSLSGLIAVLGTANFRSETPVASIRRGAGAFLANFRTAFVNRSFRNVWWSFSLFLLAVVITSTVAIHYFTLYAGIDANRLISRIQASFYSGAILGVPLWTGLGKYVDKHRLYVTSMILTALLLFGATMLFGEGTLFGRGRAVPLALGNLLAGLTVSALWVIPASMLADIADADEMATGRRREGIFFGLFNLGEKLAAGVSLLLGGVLLEHFVGLIPGETNQTPMVASRIGLLYGIIPGCMVLLAALLMRGYSLNRARVTEIQQGLRRTRKTLLTCDEAQF